MSEQVITMPVSEFEQATTCQACGDLTKGRAYCEPCYDSADSEKPEPPDTSELYYALEALGDRIRDNIGEREAWWSRLRELAQDVRELGRE